VNVIGLGRAGCKIAQKFSTYPQYSARCIDVENEGYENFIKIEKQESHEAYESNYSNLNLHLSAEPVLFVLSGAGQISGIALRLLEELKTRQVDVLYIKPSKDDMSDLSSMRDRVVSQVLQQYTRSGLINNFCLVSNESVEAVMPHISLKDYWGHINDTIVNTYHMISVFENTEPLLTTYSDKPVTAKISTIGVVNYENFEEKSFYDLQMPRVKIYYFGINNSFLEENKTLLHDVRSSVREQASENTNACFSIYSTSYENNYVYSKHYATMVQEEYLE
tara:strand:+ start:1245 stop:2078 length:834 start_codon:yes stop_codon:yes gene_type:complete